MTKREKGPATPRELSVWRGRLGDWLNPAEFGRIVDEIIQGCGDHALDQPGSVFRDAFVAHRCAVLRGADRVRLGADPPDFELRFGRRVALYETVEVVVPGRRRGLELRAERALPSEVRGRATPWPEDTWVSAQAGLNQISAQVRAKAAKAYAPGTVLVVYVNLGFVRDEAAFSSGLPDAVAGGLATFPEVWLLRQEKIEVIGTGRDGGR